MQSRTTYTLVTTLLLTVFACAKQVDGDLEEDDPNATGATSTGGSGAKAGSAGVIKAGATSSAGKGGSGTALPPAGSTGGKGGSKGTGGSAGKAGSAGSSSDAGAPGGDEDPVNMPVDGVTVEFKPQETADMVDFLGGALTVLNDSAESFSLSTLKVRYYFTNELNSPPAFVWQWGQFGPKSNLGGITCTGTVVEMPSPKTGANYYVELTCPDGDMASGNQLVMSWKAGNQGNGKLTPSDDWSFTAVDNIVVLNDNTIIWGVEP